MFDHRTEAMHAAGPNHAEVLWEQLADHARLDRRADDAVRPGDGPAACVETGDEPVVVIRAVHVVLNVLFAAPEDLDRAPPVDLLGAAHRLDPEGRPEPPSETTAHVMVVHLDAG